MKKYTTFAVLFAVLFSMSAFAQDKKQSVDFEFETIKDNPETYIDALKDEGMVKSFTQDKDNKNVFKVIVDKDQFLAADELTKAVMAFAFLRNIEKNYKIPLDELELYVYQDEPSKLLYESKDGETTLYYDNKK